MESKKKKIVIQLIALSMILCSLTFSVNAASSSKIDDSFWKSGSNFTPENLQLFAATEKKFDSVMDSLSTGESLLSSIYVDHKVNHYSTTMVVRPSKYDNENTTGFWASEKLNNALYKAGGKTLRFEIEGIAVEYPVADFVNQTNLTIVRQSENELRGAASGAWTVLCTSSDSSQKYNADKKFTLRFKLNGAFKTKDLVLVSTDSQGYLIELDTPLTITKSGDTYYARTGKIASGIYCVMQKSD